VPSEKRPLQPTRVQAVQLQSAHTEQHALQTVEALLSKILTAVA